MRTIREAGNMIEARSWRRAIAAHVISRFNSKHPDTVCRSAWPGDQKALAITKGAVSPTSRVDYPAHNIVGSFRSLAPSSAALKLFEAAPGARHGRAQPNFHSGRRRLAGSSNFSPAKARPRLRCSGIFRRSSSVQCGKFF